MKEIIKKWIAMGLVVAMTLSLSACGGSKGDSKSTDVPSNTDEQAESSSEKKLLDDLGGMEILIADWYYAPIEPETDFQKATASYLEEIQATYNFKISREQKYAYTDQQEIFTNQAMSNNPKYSLYYLYQEFVSQPMMNGLMYNLKTVPTIDFTEEKWNKMAIDLVTVGGGIYGMTAEQEPRGGLFYNKRLFEEAGIDPNEPYKLQREGNWTWEKLEEYCKLLTKDINNDGTTDQFAMASFSKYYLPAAAANNNATFVSRNEDGTYVNSTDSKEFLEAMNWGVSLIKKGYVMPKPSPKAAWDWYKSAFRDAEVAMQTAEVYEISSFAKMDDPWGFVMFPYNQKNKDATNKTVPNDNIIVMPSCVTPEVAEKICFAYDLYTEPTPEYTLEETWKETYYNQFQDPYAVDETLTMMREEEHKELSFLPMISGLDYGEFCYSVYAQAVTPAKKIEQMDSKWDKLVEDMNKKYAAFKASEEAK